MCCHSAHVLWSIEEVLRRFGCIAVLLSWMELIEVAFGGVNCSVDRDPISFDYRHRNIHTQLQLLCITS
jgi:hypothetical protein